MIFVIVNNIKANSINILITDESFIREIFYRDFYKVQEIILSPIGIKKKKFFDFVKREKGSELFLKIAKESTPEKAYERLINQGYLFEKEDMIFLTNISSFIYEKELKYYLENRKIIKEDV